MSASTVVLLPHAPSSVGQARHRLGADLRAYGVAEPAIRDATLVLSELMSNAVRHARPRTERPPSVSSLGGRGLGIVNRLSRRWGVRSDELGSTVWAVLTARQGRSGSPRFRPVLATS